MEIDPKDIENILPKKLRHICQVGICNPLYLEKKKLVYCRIPHEYGGPRWSAKPSDVLPSVKSIITLIHFTPVALDYSVNDIILVLAGILWRKLRIWTHVLDESRRPNAGNLIGNEVSFLRSTSYDARKKIILLKDIAYYAGLGQYGKDSLIINNRFGSDIKIQALLTEARLKYDKPILPKAYPGCKDCNICIKACPAKSVDNYKFFASTHDECKLVVKDVPTLMGRLCRKKDIWDKAKAIQKITCRICQSFCPVNSKHYVENSLIFARKEKQGRITFFLIKDSGSKAIRYKPKKR